MSQTAVSEPTQQRAPTTSTPPAKSLGALFCALGIGLAGTAFISFFTHWYEAVVHSMVPRQLIVYALAPLVFFLIFLVVAGVNPLLRWLVPRVGFGRREVLIILSMWLLTGVISFKSMATPVLHAIGTVLNPALERPMMKRVDFKSYLRPELFLPAQATRDYYYGMQDGATRVPWRSVPWVLWKEPLFFWVPFMVVAVVFASALVQMVHRQWSKHELLTFPMAEYADSFLNIEPQRAFPAIFYDRIFWIGFLAMFFVYLINGLHSWFPQMIEVPLVYQHTHLVREFAFLDKYCGREAYSLFRGVIYPFLVCLAVLLPTEISLTCWLGWVLTILATGFYFLFTGEVIGPTQNNFIQYGMYVAMFVMIILIGRREYGRILHLAFTWKRTDDLALRNAAIACRLFVLAFAALVALLTYAGMDWFIALVLTCSFALVLVLLARMAAEVGLPWLNNFSGMAHGLPLKMLGATAIGPKTLAVLAAVGGMLDIHTDYHVASQETIYRKLEEKPGAGIGRWQFNLILFITTLAAIGAAFFFTLWNNYSYGAQKETRIRSAIQSQLEGASTEINRLQIEGRAAEAQETTGLAKLRLARAEEGFWRFFLYGAVVVAGCALLRLRFTWWPFHPLPFLLISTWTLSRFYVSFFLGWIIKITLLRIWGGKVFIRSKPFFMGVITGQVVAAGLWVTVGGIYYVCTGKVPPGMNFFG